MDFSPIQIAMVLVIALVVFGPSRLPELGRQLGRGIREAKRQMSELGDEMTRSVDADPASSPAPSARTTTDVAAITSVTTADGTSATATAVTGGHDDLLDDVLVPGTPAGSASVSPMDDDDLLDGIVVSGDTPPGPPREG